VATLARTLGARDIGKRKVRKDKKHKYKRNRAGNLVPYIPKRKKGDPVRVWFFQMKPMSIEGYKNFARKIQPHVRRIVFRPVGHPLSVDPSALSTPEAIEQTAIDIIGFEGSFQLRMPSHSKNSFHVSYRKKAIVKIVNSEEGLKAFSSEYSNMSRYWFWRRR